MNIKKVTKKGIALAICVILTVAMAGCGKSNSSSNQTSANKESSQTTSKKETDTSSKSGESGKSLFLIPKCVGYDYWTSCQKGAEDAAAELGYKLVFNGPATTDSAQQVSMIEDAMTQGITGLAVAPNDPDAIIDTIETAIKKNINTICFDTDSPNSNRAYYVGPDSDYSMGQILGKMLAEGIGGKGKVAFMVASFSTTNQVEKVNGATDYLKENYPEIEIVTTLNSEDQNDNAYTNAQTLLSTYPDLKGILGFAGAEAPNAAAAVQEAIDNGEIEEGQIYVTGIGFPSQCREYIKSGVLKEVLSWNPQVTGKTAVYVLAALEEGKSVENLNIPDVTLKIEGTNVYHGCLILDLSNIDQYNYS